MHGHPSREAILERTTNGQIGRRNARDWGVSPNATPRAARGICPPRVSAIAHNTPASETTLREPVPPDLACNSPIRPAIRTLRFPSPGHLAQRPLLACRLRERVLGETDSTSFLLARNLHRSRGRSRSCDLGQVAQSWGKFQCRPEQRFSCPPLTTSADAPVRPQPASSLRSSPSARRTLTRNRASGFGMNRSSNGTGRTSCRSTRRGSRSRRTIPPSSCPSNNPARSR